ncbi:MAG: ribonuclease Y [Candidatus Gracilibacteria bacterium]|nr:ribonuclease Y [Candidatus Gracilibacteria bacterium]
MIIIYLLIGVILGITWYYIVNKVLEDKGVIKAKSNREKLLNEAEKAKEEILKKAKEESDLLLNKSKQEANVIVEKARQEANDNLKKAEKLEERLLEKEEKLETKLDEISKKQESILDREEKLKQEQENLKHKQEELDNKLSQMSKLSIEEARDLLLKQIAEKYEKDSVTQIEKYKKGIEERKNEVAREIIIKSIQQYAGDVTSEVTTTLIPLPNDDLKGKLIGKEGRNIVAFERATGVALIIDDTPDTVFISAFDLFRRYIAKKSLEKLLEDGRIQPARIEEIVEMTTNEADILLKDIGKKTLDELNITGVPEEIIPLIGKLRFRTSYGQNILKHSTEVAYIAESIANDLNLDPMLAKKGGLLHDIGKALDHDIEGTHPEIGAKIGRKYGLGENIIDMIENHHGEPTGLSIYAAIVQMADAISSVRPGARRESIEQYVKRVKEMEALVGSFSGVTKAYAISAGREVRVFVDADTIGDFEAHEMARNIALDIEAKLNYPGEVKVNLIREMRVIEYAK